MKRLTLSQGKSALVDDQDYPWLNRWKWYAWKSKRKHVGEVWYAARNIKRDDGSRTVVLMHRELASVLDMPDVDHRDNDGLNNCRHNLRPCTRQQNMANQRKLPRCGSRFKGVSWDKDRRRWRATIMEAGKSRYLGLFEVETEAAGAYDRAAICCFGSFAKLNL